MLAVDIAAWLGNTEGTHRRGKVQEAAVTTEEGMDGDTTKASITPIDVRCRQPGCPWARSVPGTVVQDGFAVASEAGTSCPACQHAWRDHASLGGTNGPVDTGEPIT
jgi:hypothetical protein